LGHQIKAPNVLDGSNHGYSKQHLKAFQDHLMISLHKSFPDRSGFCERRSFSGSKKGKKVQKEQKKYLFAIFVPFLPFLLPKKRP
jgi:hypothetical protein